MAEIQTREREGIVIIDFSGSLSLGYDSAFLRDEIAAALSRGRTRVVLNLEKATYLDSSWLGAIVNAFMKLSRACGQLKLLSLPPRIMDLLVMTKLSVVLDIFTSEDDAVNSFFPTGRSGIRERCGRKKETRRFRRQTGRH